ncbi:MAG: hypothetical protein IPM88_04330 [Nitrospira sp.]|nr:hypothetical protein [Nitrospira sp.]
MKRTRRNHRGRLGRWRRSKGQNVALAAFGPHQSLTHLLFYPDPVVLLQLLGGRENWKNKEEY